MSDDDDAVLGFFESQKGVSDRRAKLGTDQHRLPHSGAGFENDGSGCGSIIGEAIWILAIGVAYAAYYAFLVTWWFANALFSAISSSRR
jgi:hypothetical protein